MGFNLPPINIKMEYASKGNFYMIYFIIIIIENDFYNCNIKKI